jgi:hypothetical protein
MLPLGYQTPQAPLNVANDAGGEHEDRGDEGEDTFHRETKQAERQQHKPDDGVEHEGEQGGGPANDQEKDKKKEFHDDLTVDTE